MYNNCLYCGNSFRPAKGKEYIQKFCSNNDKCRKRYHRRNKRKAEGNSFTRPLQQNPKNQFRPIQSNFNRPFNKPQPIPEKEDNKPLEPIKKPNSNKYIISDRVKSLLGKSSTQKSEKPVSVFDKFDNILESVIVLEYKTLTNMPNYPNHFIKDSLESIRGKKKYIHETLNNLDERLKEHKGYLLRSFLNQYTELEVDEKIKNIRKEKEDEIEKIIREKNFILLPKYYPYF